MELKALTLTNFRVFKEETEIPFSPLTIITGANSSGKSSVFKALMLLQESLKEKDNNLARLNFTSGKHVLGTFESVRHLACLKDENIVFKLKFKNNNQINRFWSSVKEFIVSLEYCQDSANPLNGELERFQVDVNETNLNLLTVKRNKVDNTKVDLDIDLAWLIMNVSTKEKMETLKPQMHFVRDKIRIEKIEEEISRIIENLEKEKEGELYNLQDADKIELFEENKKLIAVIESRIENKKLHIQKVEADRDFSINNLELEYANDAQRLIDARDKDIAEIAKLKNENLQIIETQINALELQIIELKKNIELLKNYVIVKQLKRKKSSEKQFLKEKKSELENYFNPDDETNPVMSFLVSKINEVKLEEASFEEQLKKYMDYEILTKQLSDKENEVTSLRLQNTETTNHFENLKENKLFEYDNYKSTKQNKILDFYKNQIDEIEAEIELLKIESQDIVDGNRKMLEQQIEDKYKFLIDNTKRDFSGKLFTKLFNALQTETVDLLEQNASLFKWIGKIDEIGSDTIIDYLTKDEPSWLKLVQNDNPLEAKLGELSIWNDETNFVRGEIENLKLIDIYNSSRDNNIVIKFLTDIVASLISEAKGTIAFSNISSVRGIQKRIYEINKDEYSLEEAELLLLNQQLKNNKKALSFIHRWLKAFEIGDSIKTEVDEGSFSRLIISKNSHDFNIADLGLGITQFIPILIHIAEQIGSKDKQLLAIEEPEAHLHPKYQSRLADMFAEATLLGVRLVIETHSEYFIRRLQILIASKKVDLDAVKLYYFNNLSTVIFNEIPVTSDGDVILDYGNYWDGFFNQHDEDRRKLEVVNGHIRSKKTVLCENKNDRLFNKMKTGTIHFSGVRDCNTLYFSVKNNKDYYGIRDRDFITQEESELLANDDDGKKRYFFIKYYNFENYLYHPENLSEVNSWSASQKEIYQQEIIRQIEDNWKDIHANIHVSRKSSKDLEDQRLRKMVEKDGYGSKVREYFEGLYESSNFEDKYVLFDMKPKKEKGRFDLSRMKELGLNIPNEDDLACTQWFKKQISEILEPILKTPKIENLATVDLG